MIIVDFNRSSGYMALENKLTIMINGVVTKN